MIIVNHLAKIGRKRVSLTAYAMLLSGAIVLSGFGLWQEKYFADAHLFAWGSAANALAITAAYLINKMLAGHAARFFPDADQSINRVALWFGVYGAVNVALFLAAVQVYFWLDLDAAAFDLSRTLRIAFFVLSGSLIAAGVTELTYTFRQWRTNQDELELMQEKQLQTELDAVKQQVNPHFLFNCLNSLSVLIADAPGAAEKFVDEMSKVYRYQLSVNGPGKENVLTTLDSELRFIRSYIYLLEMRFENGIDITLQISEVFQCGQLVPLSLQILLDHAVHHNMVSPARPLRVTIATTENGQLEFRHNRQPKLLSIPAGQDGIRMLLSKYQLLAGDVELKEDDQYFAITLPLLFT